MPTINRKLLVGRHGPCWTERNTKPTYIVLHHTASSASKTDKTGGCAPVWSYLFLYPDRITRRLISPDCSVPAWGTHVARSPMPNTNGEL